MLQMKNIISAVLAAAFAAALAVWGAVGAFALEDSGGEFSLQEQHLMIDRSSSSYGYEYLAETENGQAKQALYRQLGELSQSFWDSDEDAAYYKGYYVIGQIDLEELGLTNTQATEVFFTFKNDHPIYYFASATAAYDGRTFCYVIYKDYAEGEVRKGCRQSICRHIAQRSAELADKFSTYDKVLALHELTADSMDYAYKSGTRQPSAEAWAHNILGAAVEGSGVCEAYARDIQLILNCIGVENVLVTGTAGSGSHAWNIVRFDDGSFYCVDCTWDDLRGDLSLFAKGTDLFYKDHTPDSPENSGVDHLYGLPEVRAEDYSFDPTLRKSPVLTGSISDPLGALYFSRAALTDESGAECDLQLYFGRFAAADTPEGSCTLTAACEGYAPRSTTVVIKKGELTQAELTLGRYGDIDLDGSISTKDALRSVAFARKTHRPESDYQAALADVNKDGKLDTKDAMLLIGICCK